MTTESLEVFAQLTEQALNSLKANESLGLYLSAENQEYIRFNRGLVRQATQVDQQRLTIDFRENGRRSVYTFDLSGETETDSQRIKRRIQHGRKSCQSLPEDPYLTPFENQGHGEDRHLGQIPSIEHLTQTLFNETQGIDFAGLYAGGTQVRATANSEGTLRGFKTQSFFLDYSIYTINRDGDNKAVKGLYAGRHYSEKELNQSLQSRKAFLPALERSSLNLPKGGYRVYLAPEAVEALVGMLSWGAVSYSAYQQGESPFEDLIRGERMLSPLFSLRENFTLGLTPRFNASGQVAPEELRLIEAGQLQTLLINDRSAREYGAISNAANAGEGLRSPEIVSGTLNPKEALDTLGTGLYLGNLHYLNWSDRKTARLTGMTRYACFWVENGEVIAPIQDLRFDESLYRIFGSELEAISQQADCLPDTQSYEERALGGSLVPGILLRDFRFTL